MTHDLTYFSTFSGIGGFEAATRDFGIRRLTPTECERLQGFPDGWTEGLSDTQRYKCLGNAVTVPVVRAIIARLFPVMPPPLGSIANPSPLHANFR